MAEPQMNEHNRRLLPTIPLNIRAKSVSETLIAMSFPTVLNVLVLGKSISKQHQLDTKAYLSLRGIVVCCIVLTAISSILGVMAWLCVSNILTEERSKKLYKASEQLIYFSSLCLMLLSFMLFLLFELVHIKSIVTMVILVLVMESIIVTFIHHSCTYKDHDISASESGDSTNQEHKGTTENGAAECKIELENGAPESKISNRTPNPAPSLQALLDLTNSVAILFFSGMAGKIFDHFSNSTDQEIKNNGTFDASLWSLYFGSLLCLVMMVANFAIPRIFPEKVNRLKYLNYILVSCVTITVLASTYKLADVYVLLEVVPLVVALFAGLLTMIDDDGPTGGGANDEHKPISMSFINLAFAGLLTALGYDGKHSQKLFHKAFTLLMSSTLVSSLIWRVLTHEPPSTAVSVAAEKVLAFLTLLLVFFSVIAFVVLAFQSL